MDIYNMPFTAGEQCGLLAVPYVRPQMWETPYQPAEALANGTVFASLNLPFKGYGGR